MLTAEILFSAVSRSLNSKFMSVLKAIGLNAIDGAMDLGFNYLSQRIGVGNQKELMDYGYEQQKDFWNRQNAYNDPSSQIVRLRAAGLNPAMLNGNSINNTAGGLSSISSPTAPQGIQPHSDVTAAMQGLSSLLTDEKQRGLLSVQTQKMGEEILNLWVERQYKQIMNRLGLTEAEMKEMQKEAMFEAYYGTGLDGGEPRIKNNPIMINMDKTLADLDASTASAEYSRALTNTENYLRNLKAEEIEQNIKESKSLVNKLSAEEKKILRETESVENLVERQEIVNACSAFYGFPVYDLPPTLTAQLVETYTLVVRGDIYPETAIRSAGHLIDEYKKKELHIPRTRSQSSSRSQSGGVLTVKSSKSSQNSWSETY